MTPYSVSVIILPEQQIMIKPKGMSQQEFEKLLDVLPTLDND